MSWFLGFDLNKALSELLNSNLGSSIEGISFTGIKSALASAFDSLSKFFEPHISPSSASDLGSRNIPWKPSLEKTVWFGSIYYQDMADESENHNKPWRRYIEIGDENGRGFGVTLKGKTKANGDLSIEIHPKWGEVKQNKGMTCFKSANDGFS